MKRDMDLIRELLLYTEKYSRPELGVAISKSNLELCKTDDQLLGHINLLIDKNLMTFPHHAQNTYYLGNLTSYGHDFLDSVRDPEIWKQTKDVGLKAGGWTIDLLGDIAKGLIKKQIKKYTDVEL